MHEQFLFKNDNAYQCFIHKIHLKLKYKSGKKILTLEFFNVNVVVVVVFCKSKRCCMNTCTYQYQNFSTDVKKIRCLLIQSIQFFFVFFLCFVVVVVVRFTKCKPEKLHFRKCNSSVANLRLTDVRTLAAAKRIPHRMSRKKNIEEVFVVFVVFK